MGGTATPAGATGHGGWARCPPDPRPRGPHGGRKLSLLRHPQPNQVLTMTILYLVILSVISCREMREMGVSVSFVSSSDSQNIGSELLDNS